MDISDQKEHSQGSWDFFCPFYVTMSNIINQLNLNDMYRTLLSMKTTYTIFSVRYAGMQLLGEPSK